MVLGRLCGVFGESCLLHTGDGGCFGSFCCLLQLHHNSCAPIDRLGPRRRGDTRVLRVARKELGAASARKENFSESRYKDLKGESGGGSCEPRL